MSAELQERARAMYVPGTVGYEAVGRQLGVSAATVRRWVNPSYNELQKRQSREAKRRRGGTCCECGAPTGYDGRGGASERCVPCANTANAAAKRGTGASQARILEILAEGPQRYSAIRDALGWSNGLTCQQLHRLVRYGFVVRVRRGVYELPQEPS